MATGWKESAAEPLPTAVVRISLTLATAVAGMSIQPTRTHQGSRNWRSQL